MTSEASINSKEINTLVDSFSSDLINYLAVTHIDFPWHLTLTGECEQLDSWLEQLLDDEDSGDLNILFMKFSRSGQYVAVQGKLTWKADNVVFYSSKKWGDWVIMEHTSFFNTNTELVKTYSCTTPDTTSNITINI